MKTVLITGASRGIGLATAKKFLAKGWFVIGTSTKGESDSNDSNFTSIKLNYFQTETVGVAVEHIIKLKKNIDVLVNNAAIGIDEFDKQVNMDVLDKTLRVNVINTINFTEKLISTINKGGHIINISSMAASLNDPIEWVWITPAYKISKAALNMYTRVLAHQLKGQRITVSSLDPGWVKTDMGGNEAMREPEEAAEDIYNLAISNIETGQFWLKGEKRNW